MSKATFTGKVERGRIDCAAKIANALATLNGKRVKITVEEVKKQRSLAQNNFLWGPLLDEVCDIEREKGNIILKGNAKNMLMALCAYTEVMQLAGREMECLRSSTTLTTQEMNDLFTITQSTYAKDGYDIGDPRRWWEAA